MSQKVAKKLNIDSSYQQFTVHWPHFSEPNSLCSALGAARQLFTREHEPWLPVAKCKKMTQIRSFKPKYTPQKMCMISCKFTPTFQYFYTDILSAISVTFHNSAGNTVKQTAKPDSTAPQAVASAAAAAASAAAAPAATAAAAAAA